MASGQRRVGNSAWRVARGRKAHSWLMSHDSRLTIHENPLLTANAEPVYVNNSHRNQGRHAALDLAST
jgi:hypothetical protein